VGGGDFEENEGHDNPSTVRKGATKNLTGNSWMLGGLVSPKGGEEKQEQGK